MTSKSAHFFLFILVSTSWFQCQKNSRVSAPLDDKRVLRLTCNVEEAEVWISGNYQGLCIEKRFLISKPGIGPIRLEIHADGYFSYYTLFESEKVPNATLGIELVPDLDIQGEEP